MIKKTPFLLGAALMGTVGLVGFGAMGKNETPSVSSSHLLDAELGALRSCIRRLGPLGIDGGVAVLQHKHVPYVVTMGGGTTGMPYLTLFDLYQRDLGSDRHLDGVMDGPTKITQKEYQEMLLSFLSDCEHSTRPAQALGLSCGNDSQKETLAVLPDYNSSIVEITNTFTGSSCTGFFTELGGEKVVLTAAHCLSMNGCEIENSPIGRNCTAAPSVDLAWPSQRLDNDIQSFHYSTGIPVPSFVLQPNGDYNPDSDWGIIALPPDVQSYVKPLVTSSYPSFEPDGNFLLIGHGASVNYSTVFFDHQEVLENGKLEYTSDSGCHGTPGFSGGPIFDVSKNAVVALISSSNSTPENTEIQAIPMIRIETAWMLSQEKVKDYLEEQVLLPGRFHHFLTTTLERKPVLFSPQGHHYTVEGKRTFSPDERYPEVFEMEHEKTP